MIRTFVAAGVLLALPLHAAAQTPDSVVVLDSLEVRILRGAQPLSRTPFAVTVVGPRALQSANSGAFLEEALQAVPGVQIQNRHNFGVGERVSIRGFGARAQFGIRGLRVLVDGIPATLPDGQSTLDHLDLGSVGRLEILRGPAAALYGNAGGGVLRFSTASPPPEPVQGAAFSFGADGLWRLQGTTSGSSGEVGYLVNVARMEYDGFRTLDDDTDELFGGAERWTANAQVRVGGVAGGTLRATLNLLDLGAENPGSLPRSVYDDGSNRAWGFNVARGTRKDVRQGQLGLSWEGPLGGDSGVRGEFSTWGILRQLDNPIPPSVIDLDRSAFGARALVGNQGSDARVTYGGGVEVEAQRDDRLNFENNGGERGALTLDQSEHVTSAGLFANVRVQANERVSLTAGARWDHFSFEAVDRFVTGDPDDSGTRSLSALSPTVGLHVRADEGVELFANVATSLSTPTTTELANRPDGAGGFNPELDPTRGLTGEVGFRTSADRPLSVEFSGYRTSLDDELVPFEDPQQPGRVFFRNAGASTYQGVEAAATLRSRSGLQLRAAYTLVDATFDEYAVDGEVFDGNRVPGVAKHRLDVVARWSAGPWFAEVRTDYVGRVAVDDANSDDANPYALVDVRTGLLDWSAGRARFSPYLGVQNLLDRRYVSSLAVNAFGGRFFEPGPGRALVGGISIRY